MIKYLYKIALFYIPLILLGIGIHLAISASETIFVNKAKYAEQNKSNVEVLILGSSHAQDAINNKWMQHPSISLAYNTQDVKTNFLLFDKYEKEMPNLKYLVFEFDYFCLEQPLNMSAPNSFLYSKFYDINIDHDRGIKPLEKISKTVFDLKTYCLYLYNSYTYKRDNNYVINEVGFLERDEKQDFFVMNYDSIKIEAEADQRLGNRHQYRFIEEIQENTKLIDSILVKCESRNITPIFITIPKYQTYIDRKVDDKMVRWAHYKDSLVTNTNILFFDYEQDPRFASVKLYSNDNHLNWVGAKTFTAIVDSIVGDVRMKNISN